ncbi:MAG: xanthine dehydrogenase family protein molybdopterin-binding subunit [Desulfomonile tiedjei]|nr:xanthine dehydrogenase family protein molybdopterin-binding subunit [Desulfomonile tiedjei]
MTDSFRICYAPHTPCIRLNHSGAKRADAREEATSGSVLAENRLKGGQLNVHRVVCAVDCGTVINPKIVEAQMSGAIAFGLTATLKGSITIGKGRAEQINFDEFPLLRMEEMPKAEVDIVPSTAPPTGIGEVGVLPVAPAVANAVFAATGKRIRRLPITRRDLTKD